MDPKIVKQLKAEIAAAKAELKALKSQPAKKAAAKTVSKGVWLIDSKRLMKWAFTSEGRAIEYAAKYDITLWYDKHGRIRNIVNMVKRDGTPATLKLNATWSSTSSLQPPAESWKYDRRRSMRHGAFKRH
jgi:hypothetical protein